MTAFPVVVATCRFGHKARGLLYRSGIVAFQLHDGCVDAGGPLETRKPFVLQQVLA